MSARLRLAVVALVAACTPAFGLELVGPAIIVNPADGPGTVLFPAVVDDEGRGFGVIWGKTVDDDPYADRLNAQFYRANRKPAGRPQRYDGKVDGEKTEGLFASQPVRLGGGAILAPWSGATSLDPYERTPYLGQLFSDQKKDGPKKTLATDFRASFSPIELRDGRAIVFYDRASNPDETVAQFIQPDGSLGASFALGNFGGFPRPLSVGFYRSVIVSGPGSAISTRVAVYDANGASEGSQFTVSEAGSVAEFGFPALLGLESGDILVLPCVRNPDSTCKLSAQLFTRAGVKKGQPKVIVASTAQRPSPIHLPDGGFLLQFTAPSATGTTLTVYHYDAALKFKGKVTASWPANVTTFPAATLTDGRVAIGYRADGGQIGIQLVKP